MKSFVALLFTLPAIALAHDIRQQGPHVHGEANVQIGVDASSVEVRLQAPGMGILSFERPPANEAEAAQLKRAIATLDSGSWVQFPATAKCVLASHTVGAEGFAAGSSEHHDHAEHHHGGHHHHAGFEAVLQYRCQDTATLSNVRLHLGSKFPSLHRVIVETATARGQSRVELQGQQQQVELAR